MARAVTIKIRLLYINVKLNNLRYLCHFLFTVYQMYQKRQNVIFLIFLYCIIFIIQRDSHLLRNKNGTYLVGKMVSTLWVYLGCYIVHYLKFCFFYFYFNDALNFCEPVVILYKYLLIISLMY